MNTETSTHYYRRGIEMARMSGDAALTEWSGGSNGGAQLRGVTFESGAKLTVDSLLATQAEVDATAKCLRVLPCWVSELCDRVDALTERLARVDPKPVRLLGEGCIRERDGGVWLLSNATKGWSSFGVRCDSWDELLRRYEVVVSAPETDACGQFWRATPRKVSP